MNPGQPPHPACTRCGRRMNVWGLRCMDCRLGKPMLRIVSRTNHPERTGI